MPRRPIAYGQFVSRRNEDEKKRVSLGGVSGFALNRKLTQTLHPVLAPMGSEIPRVGLTKIMAHSIFRHVLREPSLMIVLLPAMSVIPINSDSLR